MGSSQALSCSAKQMCKPLPERGAADSVHWNVKREREDDFLADEMLLCSGDHIIAVIYALPKVCTVLYSPIKQ